MSVTVLFQRNDNGFGTIGTERQPGLCPVDMPSYQSSGAAGIDLHSAYEVTIPAGLMRRVSTGFNVKIPEGFVGLVCSRSGLAFKHQVAVLNAPGVVDCDYTGELFVMLINHGETPVTIRRNDRVGQLVVLPVARANVEIVGAMPETERGGAGFGSTGGMPGEVPLAFPVVSPLNRLRTDAEIDRFLANERDSGRLRPQVIEDNRLPEDCALLVSPGQEPVIVRTGKRFPTPEQLERIDADMAEFRREFDCFRDKFMRLSPQEQEKVMEEAGRTFEQLGPYGPVTPSRVNRLLESYNLTPEERARLLPQLEEAEAEALADPKNQQLIADAMEKQRQPYSIGQKGV